MASGLPIDTHSPYSDSLSLRLLNRLTPIKLALHLPSNSPDHSSTGTLSGIPKDCSKGIALKLLVCIRFQVLFHSPSGVLFAFPSRYWFTIGLRRVFSLGEWSPQIPTGFHVPDGTQDTASSHRRFRIQDSHLLWSAVPGLFR